MKTASKAGPRRPHAQFMAPLVALVFIVAVIAALTPQFRTATNIRNLILQVSVTSLMAIGSTMVILTGGIDLSPGSMIALLSIIFATLIKFMSVSIPLAILVVVILGLLLGLYNGVLTAYLRVPAFITTLASLSIFRGVAFTFNQGAPISSVSPTLETIFYSTFLGIPIVLYYILLAYGLSGVILKYTPFGRNIYAIGGNAAASLYSGVNVKLTTMLTFAYAGLMTAFAAVLMATRLNSGSPNYGTGMELEAIAAAVVGGASLSGGRGTVVGTLIGAVTMVVVQNALNLHAVPTSTQRVVIGGIIMLAVSADMWRGESAALFNRLLPRRREATDAEVAHG